MHKEEVNKNLDDNEADEDNLKFLQPTNSDINKKKSDSEQIQSELKTIPNETYSSLNQNDEQENPENNEEKNNNNVVSDKKNELNSLLLNKNRRDNTPRFIFYLLVIFILSVIFYTIMFKNNNNDETSPKLENNSIKEQNLNGKQKSIKTLFENVEYIKSTKSFEKVGPN